LKPEVRTLIATMARENPTGAPSASAASYSSSASPSAPAPSAATGGAGQPDRPARVCVLSSQTTLRAIWAADVFVVQTFTFQTLYVFFQISHDRRRLLHFSVTRHPTTAWVWRQLIEATPWGQHPKYLIHDRDRVYGADMARRMAGLQIESIRTPIQAPRANSFAERWVGTARREVLDHLLTFGRQHLARVLDEFIEHYHEARPHQGLGQRPCEPAELTPRTYSR
jgi:transposase InsO family protein